MSIEHAIAVDLTNMVIPFGINVPVLRKYLEDSQKHSLESFVDTSLMPAMRQSVLNKLREELGEAS